MADLYAPLDIESYQTRMILLHPGDKGSMIRCELQRHALVNPPKYTALSYCWGDETNKRPIMVGDIQVMVTVNLEEALQQLRELHVTLLWADALSINQADKQEKSLQVRNMKQVYAKADATYAWLGASNHDGTISAMKFLGRIASNLSPLGNKSHSCVSASADISEENTLSCQRCQEKASFQTLFDLFRRPYWRRRWVIQEVTTSANSRVLCGSEILNLDDMADALRRCSRSRYWQPQHRRAYRFLRKILYFRNSYHDDIHLTLCKTILSTQGFSSKNRQDKVFALIGICNDGIELVPTASYHCSVEQIAVEITRELLRRNARFDLILAQQPGRCSRRPQFPSWSPDWFSRRLSETTCAIAEEQPYLSRRHGARSLRGDTDTLHVQGVVAGTVVATTSTLGPSRYLSTTPALIPSGRSRIIPDNSNYYGRHTLAAILTCLLVSSTMHNHPVTTDAFVHRHFLLQAIRPRARDKTQDFDEEGHHHLHAKHLHEWLLQNGNFLIGGRKLHDWMQKTHGWFYLPMPYVVFCLLPLGMPVLVTALLSGAVILLIVINGAPVHVLVPIVYLIVFIITSSLGLLLGIFAIWRSAHMIKNRVREAVKISLPPPTKLILMNTGALGMACSGVNVGDKICLIAGCKLSAVVLREKQVDDRALYTVVGRSMVCMSNEDVQRYRAFLAWDTTNTKWTWFGRLLTSNTGRELEAEEYNQLIDEYALRSEWKDFALI